MKKLKSTTITSISMAVFGMLMWTGICLGQGYSPELKAQKLDFFNELRKRTSMMQSEKGRPYHIRMKQTILPKASSERQVRMTEMTSDGVQYHYRTDQYEIWGDRDTYVKVDNEKKEIEILRGDIFDPNAAYRGYMGRQQDSLFAHCRLVECMNMTIEGKAYLKMSFVVPGHLQGIYGLRQMDYFINEDKEQVERIQMVYANRPFLSRERIDYEAQEFIDGPVFKGNALSRLFNGKKIKSNYQTYQVIDRRNS